MSLYEIEIGFYASIITMLKLYLKPFYLSILDRNLGEFHNDKHFYTSNIMVFMPSIIMRFTLQIIMHLSLNYYDIHTKTIMFSLLQLSCLCQIIIKPILQIHYALALHFTEVYPVW